MVRYIKSSRYELPRRYRGCTIKDVGSTYVCVNEFGRTIGESLTIPGCEGVIDDYLDTTLKGKSAPSDRVRVAVESMSNVYDDIGLSNYGKPEYKEWRKANNVVTLQDLCEQEGKRIVRYNAVPMDATGIETVFDFSSRLGGCVDSFRYYNDYVIIDN